MPFDKSLMNPRRHYHRFSVVKIINAHDAILHDAFQRFKPFLFVIDLAKY